jgi:hypothetical protein
MTAGDTHSLRGHPTTRWTKFLAIAVALLSGLLIGHAQELTPPPEPPATTAPASDGEETGALTDLIPDIVDPLTLPMEENAVPASADHGLPAISLFPGELWSGDRTVPPPPDESQVENPPPAVEESTLTEEVAASCFGPAPPPPLHDPYHLLTPSQTTPLATLIRESLNARGTFQTSVVLLKPSQQIPVTLNAPELLQRWYGDSKGLLVLYFMGRPERTQAFFSPATRQLHRSEDLRQVVDFSVREASRMAAPLAQLQRFCYKSAIRLDRLHRQGVVTPDEEPEPVTAAAPGPAIGLWWAFAIGIHAAGLGAAGVWWWRRRRREPGRAGIPIQFPEQDLVYRLGAPHSGGFGAVIHFGPSGSRL